MSSSLLRHVAAHASSHVCLTASSQHDVKGKRHVSALFMGGKRGATIWRQAGRGRGRVVVASVEDGRGNRWTKNPSGSNAFKNFGRSAMLVAIVGVTSVTSSLLSSPSAMAAESVIACQEELGGADPNTVFIVACVVEFLALTGAAVGGILARQRKDELELINSQLRQINISLRKQARVESYAPTLSYAPVGTPAVASRLGGSATAVREVQLSETDTRLQQDEKDEVIRLLKSGKRHLREQRPQSASVEFEKALSLAKAIGDRVEEKKAARGLGASYQRQNKFKEAINYHKMVLEISKVAGETSGDTEANGAIADCYTELGDLECAAKYYDKYISLLNQATELDNQE